MTELAPDWAYFGERRKAFPQRPSVCEKHDRQRRREATHAHGGGGRQEGRKSPSWRLTTLPLPLHLKAFQPSPG